MPSDLLLRPAMPDDAGAVADVHLAARAAATARGAMPAGVHPDDEARAWLRGRLEVDEVWVAEVDGRVAGYARMAGQAWLDDLYVHPAHQGDGVGTALLELAMSLRPTGLELWVFASNTPARAFYARHGLIELETTDGSANEERSPDVRMAWPGEDPLSFLRARIDEVDVLLGDLLARRAALTAAVQPLKTGSGRDPEREAACAARVAARVPALPADGVARIVHTIISESLAAGPAGE